MLAGKSRIRKVGNSKALLLSAEICDSLDLALETEIELHIEDGALVILPLTPSLSDLVNSVKPQSFSELQTGNPQGTEK